MSIPPTDTRFAPRIVARPGPRIALVLGGGGLKGFAHIGVLRALRERGIRPVVYAGASIGALLAAAAAGGMSPAEMAWRAERLERRDLFRLNHYQMLLDRIRVSSLYAAEPLRALIDEVVPLGTFDDLPLPVLVNTVDLVRCSQVVWGLRGLSDVSVRDAVYASCALPGFFPPGAVNGRVCVDGGTTDNMPVSIAARPGGIPPVDAVIAIDVGNADLLHDESIGGQGFAQIFMRAASAMMHALQEAPLQHWNGPPMLLVRPKVSHFGWFAFGHTPELIEEGYRSTVEALRNLDELLTAEGGIWPRRPVRVRVDRERCTGCGLCAAMAPRTMGLDGTGKAFALSRELSWSPADGDFVRHCPTAAIEVDDLASRVLPILDDDSDEPVAPDGVVPPPDALRTDGAALVRRR
ncbi:Patatin [Gemmatirosa kalamazoonensis]|uniref:Patatin n=1 Tax=Gemmatirosa kalamazoonensis TaxID=861299 RepID=W0RMR8_9BACT|nr:patatin-like phospholipase family protein [Gemmatirosa kalamazoonensis]AHG91762.1 Patatin [Gemmatirosa kalamazoonensis]